MYTYLHRFLLLEQLLRKACRCAERLIELNIVLGERVVDVKRARDDQRDKDNLDVEFKVLVPPQLSLDVLELDICADRHADPHVQHKIVYEARRGTNGLECVPAESGVECHRGDWEGHLWVGRASARRR